jgi:serine/threonine-protein kinase HipA
MFGHELAAVSTKELKKLNRTYFERFGKELGLTNKQIESVFNRLAKNKVKAVEWIQQSFLSDELKEDYLELLEVRYQLFIANCDTQY